jgi:hypothetical protein
MKIIVNNIPKKPEECLFCVQNDDNIFPPKCKLRLSYYAYGHGLTWSTKAHDNCTLSTKGQCEHLEMEVW